MSISNLYTGDTKATFKDVSCYSVESESVSADAFTVNNKYFSPGTNISPQPTLMVTSLCGVIELINNVAFPAGDSYDLILQSPDILATSVVLLSWGPIGQADVQEDLRISLKAIAPGACTIAIHNSGAGAYTFSPITFSYMIV